MAGYLGLFISSFLAATIIPMSSEAVLALMISQGYDAYAVLTVATAGNWLGGMSSYALGRLGNFIKVRKFTGVKETSVRKWELKIKRWGAPFALLCWTPVFGDVIAIALGFFRLKVVPVGIYMLVGKLLRYVAVIYFADLIWG